MRRIPKRFLQCRREQGRSRETKLKSLVQISFIPRLIFSNEDPLT